MNSRLSKVLLGLMTILILAVVLLVGISIGASAAGNTEFLTDTISGWIAALATVVIAHLTIVLAFETQAMRALQKVQIDDLRQNSIRPNIDVFLRSTDAAFDLSEIVVRNNGNGVAKNIKFAITHIEGRGPKADANNLIKKLLSPAFISTGISNLGPGREMKSYVISFYDMAKQKDDEQFDVCLNVSITCEDTDNNKIGFDSVIDLTEYRGMAEVGGRPLYEISKEVKAIKELFNAFVSGSKSPKIQIYDREDRKSEEDHHSKRVGEAQSQ